MREALRRSEQRGRVTPGWGAPSSPTPAPPCPRARPSLRGSPAHLGEGPKGGGEDELAVLPVKALPLAGGAQVVVRAHAALVAGPHHWPIATVTDHVGVHQAAGCLLGTRGAVVPPTLLLLCREDREPRGGTPRFPLVTTVGLSVSGPWPCSPDTESVRNPAVRVTATRGPKNLPGGSQSLCLVPSTCGPGK